jgi:hypothetical protein
MRNLLRHGKCRAFHLYHAFLNGETALEDITALQSLHGEGTMQVQRTFH